MTETPANQIRASSDDWLQRNVIARRWRVALLVGGLVAVTLTGVLADLAFAPGQTLWRRVALPLLLIGWLLLLNPWRARSTRAALAALDSLKPTGDRSVTNEIRGETHRSAWRELLAGLPGLLVGVLVTQPWQRLPNAPPTQTTSLIVLYVFFTLGSMVIDTGMRRNRMFTRLLKADLQVDVLDMSAFQPIAAWALGICVSTLGSITLVIVLYPDPIFRFPGNILFGAGILGSLTLFVGGLIRTHRIMQDVKKRELTAVRGRLKVALDAMKEASVGRHPGDLSAESSAVSAWLGCEHRLASAPQWPYTGDTIRTLVFSVLVPLGVAAVQFYYYLRH